MKNNNHNRAFHFSLASALMLGSMAFSASAFAATSTANLGVSAQILDACTIEATPVDFGNYDHAAPGDKTATGSVTETCTNGTATVITLGQGANPAAGSVDGVPLRQMASGPNSLRYFLYSDAGMGTLWGNTPATGVPQVGNGGAGTNLIVYGRVAAGQNVPTGLYADTVIATVTF